MKRVLGLLRSMKFGMVLLALIALLSILGTVIPQEQAREVYEAAYGSGAQVVLFLGLDHLYSTWYYIGLYLLLGVSLLFCSVLRFNRVKHARARLLAGAARAEALEGFRSDEPEAILRKKGFRKACDGWIRNGLGLYGSFITHLSLLLMLVACACVFALEVKTDYTIRVGESVTLEDGTVLRVDGFSLESDGRLDYVSDLSATLPDGAELTGTIRVNQPMRAGRYKIYQSSYEYAGQVDVRTSPDGEDERASLDSAAFLTLDGKSGISYMGGFDTYLRTADGQFYPVGYPGVEGTEVKGYMTAVIDEDGQRMKLAEVDETIEVGGVYYTFRSPEAYPGLRVKSIPSPVMPTLYASFALLLIGLYLCFFHVPAAAVVRGDGIALKCPKDAESLEDALREAADGAPRE